MEHSGVALSLCSAITQAGAHALLKSGKDKLVIRGIIGATCAIIVLPLIILSGLPHEHVVPWLILGSTIHTVYQLVLIKAYEKTDFSVAYPLARGIAPVATATFGVLLLGDHLSHKAIAGIIFVTCGMLSVYKKSNVSRIGALAALTAGVLTTFYTLVDGYAVRISPSSLAFTTWFFILDGMIMCPLAFFMRRERFIQLVRNEGSLGIVAGFSSLITYGLAIFALRISPVGIVSALRETSVVFGTVIAFLVLKESISIRRALAVMLIAIGGICVAI